MQLPSLSGLRAFEAVARHLSFKLAAAELAVTPTAISHRIRRLEEELVCELFHRQTRSISLSAAGQVLLPDVRDAFQRLEAAAAKLRDVEGPDNLTISSSASFVGKWLVPRLGDFQRLHPDIDIRISTSMAFSNFRDDGVDLGIRYGRGSWPGLRADLLLHEDHIPVAAPALVRGEHPLISPADLTQYTLLHLSAYPDDWQSWLIMAGFPDLKPVGNLTFDDPNTMLQAAINGLGIALSMRAIAAADIAAGHVVTPFKLSLPKETAYYLVTPIASQGEPKITAFRDWVLAQVA